MLRTQVEVEITVFRRKFGCEEEEVAGGCNFITRNL